MSFDIYKEFKVDNSIEYLPNITISESESDITEIYEKGSRLDKFADDYYNNPLDYKLILMANPKYSIEFDIPEGETIRIPFPRESAILRYKEAVKRYKRLNG